MICVCIQDRWAAFNRGKRTERFDGFTFAKFNARIDPVKRIQDRFECNPFSIGCWFHPFSLRFTSSLVHEMSTRIDPVRIVQSICP